MKHHVWATCLGVALVFSSLTFVRKVGLVRERMRPRQHPLVARLAAHQARNAAQLENLHRRLAWMREIVGGRGTGRAAVSADPRSAIAQRVVRLEEQLGVGLAFPLTRAELHGPLSPSGARVRVSQSYYRQQALDVRNSTPERVQALLMLRSLPQGRTADTVHAAIRLLHAMEAKRPAKGLGEGSLQSDLLRALHRTRGNDRVRATYVHFLASGRSIAVRLEAARGLTDYCAAADAALRKAADDDPSPRVRAMARRALHGRGYRTDP